MTSRRYRFTVALVVASLGLAAVGVSSAQADSAGPARRLESAIARLVAHPKGPPGVIVVVQRGFRSTVYRAGEANVQTGAPMSTNKHMRIASTAKAYSGGVALSLVAKGVLSLSDTIGERLPWAPRNWHRVTLAQALHHTSGLPDYTDDDSFLNYLVRHLEEAPTPRRLLRFVAGKDLRFDPGSEYKYSNSDNIVAALMIEDATGRSYERVLANQVLNPLGLDRTSLPRGVRIPSSAIRGYEYDANGKLEDVTKLAAAGYAWASGGIVSTPAEQNEFIRGYIGRDLFGRQTQQAQFDFRPGLSDPPGPGTNAAGLAVFRYRTGCGTMFGHTGNISGYTQFFAASRDGRQSVGVSVNRQTTPKMAPEVFQLLRNVYRLAVCTAANPE